MAQEADQDDLKAGISEKFRKFSRFPIYAKNFVFFLSILSVDRYLYSISIPHSAFEDLSVNLLDFIFRQNDTNAQNLLTYELQNWGKQTCLTLAVSANHRRFLAHPCCQILIADLWLGGLRIRRSINLKVCMTYFFSMFLNFRIVIY